MPDPYRISSIFFDTLYHEIDMEISYFLTYHTLRYLVYKGNYGRLDTTHVFIGGRGCGWGDVLLLLRSIHYLPAGK